MNNMNIVIPMAGLGQRFRDAGYLDPKPLIRFHGKSMIEHVIDNINLEGNYIFLVQQQHYQDYKLEARLKNIHPNCKIICVDGITEGAVCTTLLAESLINTLDPLIIANSDQLIEWDPLQALNHFKQFDAGILTFTATDPKWSFARVDNRGLVIEVAEKRAISDNATVGIYYWNKGSDYVKYAKQMIEKNIRVNNEFYVCPVFNEAIADNKHVTTYHIDTMRGVGSPEDLENYLNENNCS